MFVAVELEHVAELRYFLITFFFGRFWCDDENEIRDPPFQAERERERKIQFESTINAYRRQEEWLSYRSMVER
jgi:hypothetical protein